MASLKSKIAFQVQRLLCRRFLTPTTPVGRIRHFFERVAFASAEKLNAKYPKVKFQPIEVAGIPCEWVAATGGTSRTIFYLHGGGYFSGSMGIYRRFAMRLSYRCGVRVLLVDYRLAPENPFPAALDDAKKVYRWLIENQDVDPRDLISAGDSAGGGLTLATLMEIRESGLPLPSRAVILSPWTDLAGTGASIQSNAGRDTVFVPGVFAPWASWYVGENDPKNPQISPLYGDFKGLPPLFIQVGDRELLLEDSRRVAEKAKAAGVSVSYDEWKSMQHVWPISFPGLRESREAVKRIANFINS